MRIGRSIDVNIVVRYIYVVLRYIVNPVEITYKRGARLDHEPTEAQPLRASRSE
jgi:hypothetical protein